MNNVYFGFDSKKSIETWLGTTLNNSIEILFASLCVGNANKRAFILYKEKNKLYTVDAYANPYDPNGFYGSWKPKNTTYENLHYNSDWYQDLLGYKKLLEILKDGLEKEAKKEIISKELLGCPFCGSKAHLTDEDKNKYSVYCLSCHVQTRPCDSIQEAEELWNHRQA